VPFQRSRNSAEEEGEEYPSEPRSPVFHLHDSDGEDDQAIAIKREGQKGELSNGEEREKPGRKRDRRGKKQNSRLSSSESSEDEDEELEEEDDEILTLLYPQSSDTRKKPTPETRKGKRRKRTKNDEQEKKRRRFADPEPGILPPPSMIMPPEGGLVCSKPPQRRQTAEYPLLFHDQLPIKHEMPQPRTEYSSVGYYPLLGVAPTNTTTSTTTNKPLEPRQGWRLKKE